MRTCPRCHYPLHDIHNGKVIASHCEVCRGNFFDTRAVAPTWGKAANPQFWVEQNIADWRGNAGLVCPVDQTPLDAYRLSWEGAAPVEVDVCPSCRGLWLDEHEGGQMMRVVEAHADERAEAESLGWKSYLFQLFTGMPIEVWNPVKRRPWVLYGLMASLVLVFGWEVWLNVTFGARGEEWIHRFALVPATIMDGRDVHGLVTHAFLHAGALHLLGNLYFLWIFGDNIEDRVGWQRFVVIYAITGLVAGLVQLLSDPSSTIPVLGASGAISGVTGAYLALFPRVRVWVMLLIFRFQIAVYWYFGLWIVLQIASAWAGLPGVAWYAHIGGFLGGVVLGALFRRPLRRRVEQS